jgi:hypothetical protein
VVPGMNPIDVWLNKLRHVRKFLKGWAKNQSGKYKKEKERLLAIIDHFDIKAETSPLSSHEREEFKKANESLNELRREEESKWAQRAKVKHIQGGNNTRYFYLIENGKHRKKNFFKLEQQEETTVGEDNLKVYITEFYKNIFGPPDPSNISLVEEVVPDIPQISSIENEILTTSFTLLNNIFHAVDFFALTLQLTRN